MICFKIKTINTHVRMIKLRIKSNTIEFEMINSGLKQKKRVKVGL